MYLWRSNFMPPHRGRPRKYDMSENVNSKDIKNAADRAKEAFVAYKEETQHPLLQKGDGEKVSTQLVQFADLAYKHRETLTKFGRLRKGTKFSREEEYECIINALKVLISKSNNEVIFFHVILYDDALSSMREKGALLSDALVELLQIAPLQVSFTIGNAEDDERIKNDGKGTFFLSAIAK